MSTMKSKLMIAIVITALWFVPLGIAEEHHTGYIVPPHNEINLPNLTEEEYYTGYVPKPYGIIDINLTEEESIPLLPKNDNVNTTPEIIALQKVIDVKGYNWTAGRTSVSDFTTEEMSKLCGLKVDNYPNTTHLAQTPISNGVRPDIVSWQEWMTPVKNQGTCGSCWAFATLGLIEAMANIEAGNSGIDIDLSEQHLVSDCCDVGDCNGGYYSRALDYIKYNGVCTESCFPYLESNSPCTLCPNWRNDCGSTEYLMSFDISDEGLKRNLNTYGPLGISLYITSDWKDYRCGIFKPVNPPLEIGHAVILVGYNDIDEYWTIKNSWGEDWGEEGYMRIGYGNLDIRYYSYIVTDIGYTVPGDQYEADDTSTYATNIDINGAVQYHDFHDSGDYDWMKFQGITGEEYTIETTTLGIDSDTYMVLCYWKDGEWNYKYDDDSGIGHGSKIVHESEIDHDIYVMLRQCNVSKYGPDTTYSVSVRTPIPQMVTIVATANGVTDTYTIPVNTIVTINATAMDSTGNVVTSETGDVLIMDDDITVESTFINGVASTLYTKSTPGTYRVLVWYNETIFDTVYVTFTSVEPQIVTIGSVTMEHGTTVDIPIQLLDSTSVDGVTVTLTFDQSIVNTTNVVAGDFDGFFTPDYSDVGTGTLRITCMASGTDLTGDLTIATVTLDAVGTSGSCTLGLSAELSTSYGTSVMSIVKNGTFSVYTTQYDSADTNQDCVISSPELMVQIGKWREGTIGSPEIMTSIGRWRSGEYC